MEDLVNIHVHPVDLEYSSRILKCLETAGESRCFSGRLFIGAGDYRVTERFDAAGAIMVQLIPRYCNQQSSTVRKAAASLVWQLQALRVVLRIRPSVVNVHGLTTLPLGALAKLLTQCRLVYDTHELESETLMCRGLRRFVSKIVERGLIGCADRVVCVGGEIAKHYQLDYRLECPPLVVRNIPQRRSPTSQVLPLAQCTAWSQARNERALTGVYVGVLEKGRHLEAVLIAWQLRGDAAKLFIYGKGSLQSLVEESARKCNRICYRGCLSATELAAEIAGADFGIVGVENGCKSYYLSLPNKLFEYICAGLPVLAPDYPEISGIVRQFNCGVLHNGSDVDLMARLVQIAKEDVDACRSGARLAASTFSWETESAKLLEMYHELVGPESRK